MLSTRTVLVISEITFSPYISPPTTSFHQPKLRISASTYSHLHHICTCRVHLRCVAFLHEHVYCMRGIDSVQRAQQQQSMSDFMFTSSSNNILVCVFAVCTHSPNIVAFSSVVKRVTKHRTHISLIVMIMTRSFKSCNNYIILILNTNNSC